MRKKNIVFYVTKQYMKQNKKRTFTTFLGIVFMVLLMTCVFVGKDTALNYLEKMAEKNNGSWHYCVYDVNAEQYDKIKNMPSIAETAVSEEVGFTEFEQSENEKRPYLNVKAYTEQCFDWRNIELVSGRFPENEQEIIISENAIDDGAKVSIGDKIKAEFFTRSITGINPDVKSTIFPMADFLEVHYGETLDVPEGFYFYGENESFRENKNMTGKTQTYKVVGFMKSPYYEVSAHAGYAALTCEKAPVTDTFNVTMKVDFKHCNDVIEVDGQLLEILGEEVKTEANNMLLAFTASGGDSTINILVAFIQIFFVVFILVASIILIYNLFNMSFEERSKYLGMLSSVGATGKQKRSSVYFEAFYLLLFALPVGFLIGLGVIQAGMLAIRPYVGMMMELSGSSELEKVSIVFYGKSIVTILVVCIVAVLVSSYLPARKIGKVGAISSIRGEHTGKKFYPTAWLAIKKGGGEALLAGNTLKRQKRKTKGIVGAAAIFMIIVIVTTFGATTVTKMVRYKMVDSYTIATNPPGWEYCLSELDSATYESLKEQIITNDSVTDYIQWYSGMFFAQTSKDSYSQEYWKDYYSILSLYYPEGTNEKEMDCSETNTLSIIAVDQKTFEKIAENSNCDKKTIAKKNAAIVVQNGEISTETLSVPDYKVRKYQFFEIEKMTDKKIGETIPVYFYNKESDKEEEMNLTVSGYTTNDQLDGEITIHDGLLWVIVNEDTAETLRQKTRDENGESGILRSLYFNVDSSGDAFIEELEKMNENDASETFIFRNTEEKNIGVTIAIAINSVVEILAVCFVILTSLLCLLNLYNSIRGRVEGRKKEFAIMASIGMTKKQMKKMLFLECIGISGKSMLWTVLIATPVIFGLWKVLSSCFGYLAFSFPWISYLVAMCLSGVVVLLITLLCFAHQKTENIMDDIRTESV